ncbi:ABC transporter permease [Bacteroidia bacterium]|nr:ABC transporter permease [Bacteroidia bacterium]
MKTIIIAFRSLFKKGKNNMIKITSLGVGLAVGLVLIAKVYYEQTYEDFFPGSERIYRLWEAFTMGDEAGEMPRASGGVAPGFMEDIPEVEVATRITNIGSGEDDTFFTPDKKKYKGNFYLADTCLFDVLPRRILMGDPKDVLARPMYAMVSKKIADKLGGVDAAMGQTIVMNSYPDRTLTIGGVFEDLPLNSHLHYNVLVSLNSIGQFMGDGSKGWFGNDRYFAYAKLQAGVTPDDIAPAIRRVLEKNIDKAMLEKMGVTLTYTLKPLLDSHKKDPDVKRMTALLAILAFALIFTAVMNYVLIVISSLVGRSKEMAVNKCYGASGTNIYGKMLAETFADMVMGLVVAMVLIGVFRGTVEDLLGTAPAVMLNWRSGLLLGGVCLVVLLVSGIVPGYMFARVPVAAAFRNYRENKRFWKLGLLFLQITAAGFLMTLLVIIARQYDYMLKNNPGYEYEQLAYTTLSGVDRPERQRVLEEIARLPEVAAVTTCTDLPIDEHSGNNVKLPGGDQDLFNIADAYNVGDNYHAIMGIPVIAGRPFLESAEPSNEIMVNRSFVERMKVTAGWTDDVIGRQVIVTEHSGKENKPFTICGVYENYRIGVIGKAEKRPSAMFYDKIDRTVVIKYHNQTPEANQHVAQTLERLLPDKDIAVYSYTAEMRGKYVESRRFRDSVLIGGIVTLVITLIGLIAYTRDEINRRRKETAIRKVNGATLINILRMFMGDINRIALPAVVIGGGVSAYVATKWLAQFSEKTSLSPFIFLLCTLAVLVIVMLVVSINCYKAANENPALSIKSE